MNLTPEEKFNQEVWWVLQQLKYLEISGRKKEGISFLIKSRPIRPSDEPLPSVQESVLFKLEEWKAIRILNQKAEADTYGKNFIYKLEILRYAFNEIYEKFRKLTEKYQFQYDQPIEIFTNEVIPGRTTTKLQRQMDETRRWEAERMERERLHKEQMKQSRILRTPADKHTHALDLIIERSEYAEDGNNFSIEFYDFNFEQMIGSKMLEKFLTEMQKDGCFEQYTRTNYGGDTRFGFIKPSVKKLKVFREKRGKQQHKILTLKAAKEYPEKFVITVKDREIWVNGYLLSKPHFTGSNFEFFEYVRSQPANTKIERKNLPSQFGNLSLREQIRNKGFIKILNELGFKGEILKAFFPKRGKSMLTYKGNKITKADLEKSGIKIPLFTKELELAHIKNSPK